MTPRHQAGSTLGWEGGKTRTGVPACAVGSWEQRVYWGDDRLGWGSRGTPGRRAGSSAPHRARRTHRAVDSTAHCIGRRVDPAPPCQHGPSRPLPTTSACCGAASATDNGLYTRSLGGLFGAFPPVQVGHATQVVALAATTRLLFCATADHRPRSRPPAGSDVNWTPIGDSLDVTALTAHDVTLLGVTSDGKLWRRRPADRAWDHAASPSPRSPVVHHPRRPALAPTL